MAKRKKRGIRFRILVPIVFLGVLVLVFFLIANPLFHLDFGLIRTDTTSTSVAVLSEVRDVFTLNTVEFIYKTVFPHDFIPDNVDWNRLLRKRRDGVFLTEDEKAQLEVYDLCGILGISASRESYDFVVVTSIVKGGFDFRGTIYENPEFYRDRIPEVLRVREDGRVELVMPRPAITNLIIEDSSSATYFYPDMNIGPERWKTLTAFVRRRVEALVTEEGILDLSRQRGEALIRQLLTDAGFREVVFPLF